MHVFHWSVWHCYIKYPSLSCALSTSLIAVAISPYFLWSGANVTHLMKFLIHVGWSTSSCSNDSGGPSDIFCLFLVLLLVPYKYFLLMMCWFKLEYYALLVGILWLYWYMSVVYLYLCIHILSILYLHGTLSYRSVCFGLGMIITSRFCCVYESIPLLPSLACLLLSWEMVWAFSVSFSISSTYVLLAFLGVFLWVFFGNWVGSHLLAVYPGEVKILSHAKSVSLWHRKFPKLSSIILFSWESTYNY